MTSTTSVVHAPIWHCDPNAITCRNGHLFRLHKSDMVLDQRRIDGHIFQGCQQCNPTSFFFGVVTSRPTPMITCYAITREQFDYWNNSVEDALPTPEMLYRLGYNPSWRPSRNG